MKEIIETAKKVSKERGYIMYIIQDFSDDSFGFTQEKSIFLYDTQEIIGEVDGDNVLIY